ncbi:MAG: hypothetical protein J0G29_01725, partial [Alphaproteobacteria bacterium]|nr:hypothetical protein [Alphaproteobacteria bacterium]
MTALHTQLIPHLCGGISKQPAYLRGITMSEDELNTWPSLSEGLRKKPPTSFVAKLNIPASESILFCQNLEISEKLAFTLVITPGQLHMFDPFGKSLAVEGGLSLYLIGQNFAAITIADETFILNKNKTPQMLDALDTKRPFEGMVFIRQAIRDTTYSVSINVGSSEHFFSHSTKVLSRDQGIDTDMICNSLYSQMRSSLPSSFKLQQQGSKILIQNEQTDFTLKAMDGFGDQGIQGIKDTIGDFAELLHTAFVGFTVEVSSDPRHKLNKTLPKDSYYVWYQGNGVWTETVKGGLKYAIDPTTMPHKLSFNEEGRFKFEAATWKDRDAGDDQTAPEPSFIGTPISDMVFYKSRLGLLCGSNIVFSETDDITNFWPTTTATVIDSDPIDLTVSANQPVLLNYAVPTLNGNLLLFANQDQFLLTVKDILSPHTVSINIYSHYSGITTKPMEAEQSIVFATKHGNSTEVREISPTLADSYDNSTIETLTDHVPSFLPDKLTESFSLTKEKLLGFYRPKNKTIYIYKYHWRKDIKVQSAWTKWEFPHEIEAITATADGLTLIAKTSRGERLMLKMALREEAPIYLDSLTELTNGTFDLHTIYTSWSLPFLPENGLRAFAEDGTELEITIDPVSNQCRVGGNYS